MYYIGVDLGGTNIAAGIVDQKGNIITKGKLPTKRERPADEIVADMATLCHALLAQAGLTVADVACAGVATPGAVDLPSGTVRYVCNLRMRNYPLVQNLAQHLPVPRIYLENDANAAALAEAKVGAGKGCESLILITLGTGVGGGIVIDNKLYAGFHHAGAELGHTVIAYGGRLCGCGRRGCWEAYSSASALIAQTKEKMEKARDSAMWHLCNGSLKNVSARMAFDAAKRGDGAAQAVVDEYVEYLACGVTNMINALCPEVLCIGGGVCGEGEYLLRPLRALVEKKQYGSGPGVPRTQLKIAALGNDAGIIGAALLGS